MKSIDIEAIDGAFDAGGNDPSLVENPRLRRFVEGMKEAFGTSTVALAAPALDRGLTDPQQYMESDEFKERQSLGAALVYLVLMYGFHWSNTEEGDDFWLEISEKLVRIAKEGE